MLAMDMFPISAPHVRQVEDDMDVTKFDIKRHKVPVLLGADAPTDPLQVPFTSLRLPILNVCLLRRLKSRRCETSGPCCTRRKTSLLR
jgi:hypothetical protein